MKIVLIFCIILCIIFPPLLPFVSIPLSLYNNMDNTEVSVGEVIELPDEEDYTETEQIDTRPIPEQFIHIDGQVGGIEVPKLDAELSIGEIVYLQYPKELFEINEEMSIDLLKLANVTYCDTFVKMGVLAYESDSPLDVYTGMVSTLTDVDKTEIELSYEKNSNNVYSVYEYKQDNVYHTLYCIKSDDNKTVFWMETERKTEEDLSYYIIQYILESVNFTGSLHIEETKPFGFVDKNLDVELDTSQVIVGDKIINVGMNVGVMLSNGFSIKNSTLDTNTLLSPNQTYSITFVDDKHAEIPVIICNRYDSSVGIIDCTIKSINIEFAKFNKVQSMPDDYVVLPQGVTRTVYTEDVIECYGEPTNIVVNEDKTATCIWKFPDRTVKITLGSISYIKNIEIILE